MRIIKEGKIKETPKEIEKECEHCGCVFAYEKDDVHYGMSFWPNCRDVEFVECPFCGKRAEVENVWK